MFSVSGGQARVKEPQGVSVFRAEPLRKLCGHEASEGRGATFPTLPTRPPARAAASKRAGSRPAPCSAPP